MDLKQRLELNLDKLKENYPEFPIKIPFLKTEGYRVIDQEDRKNIVYQEPGRDPIYYYPQENLNGDIDNWLSHNPLHMSKGSYIYGIGLGYHYSSLKNWLEEDAARFIVFIEDDLKVLKLFLQTELATEIIDHPQVELLYLDDFSEIKTIAERLSWIFVNYNVSFDALAYYREYKSESFEQLKLHFIGQGITTYNMVHECTNQHGWQYYDNVYHNLTRFDRHYEGAELLEQFKDKPMILCGAGPSLHKNMHRLAQLKDKATIIAGGSAMKALFKKGVAPHLGAGVDPTDKEYELFRDQYGFEMPIIFIPRLSYLAQEMIHGAGLLFVGRKGEYSLQKWMEDELGIKTTGSWGGISVLTFSISVALRLGANPIILTGVDLANTNNLKYADGVCQENRVNSESPHYEGNWWLGSVEKTDIFGQPIHTHWKWVIESHWISEMAKNHPHVTFINATEGGIGFEGIPNMSLEEVEKKYLRKSCDLSNLLHQKMMQLPKVNLPKELLFSNLGKLYLSFERVAQICLDLSDAVKISAFNLDRHTPMLPFEQLERSMMEKIATTPQDPKEQQLLVEYLLSVQRVVEDFATTCQDILSKIQAMEMKWKDRDSTPKQMFEALRKEIAYEYALDDLHRMYHIKHHRHKQGLRIFEEETQDLCVMLKNLQKKLKVVKIDLQQFYDLRQNCGLHKILIEEVIRYRAEMGDDVQAFYEAKKQPVMALEEMYAAT